MQTHALNILVILLASIAMGCQRNAPPILDPVEKVEVLQDDVLTQGLTKAVKEFSSTTDFTILAAGSTPALSPNGQRIAFTSDFSAGGSHIWVMDIDGDNLTQLSSLDQSTNPQWSTDAQSIIFQSYGPKNWLDPRNWLGETRTYTIWSVDVDGKNQHQLISSYTEGDRYPIWSPNGAHFVWTRGKRLWIADSNGRNTRPLTEDLGLVPKAIKWSSDSQTVFSEPAYPLSTLSSEESPQARCSKKTIQATDIKRADETHLIRTSFEPILRENSGPFYFCVEQYKLLKVDTRNTTSQHLEYSLTFFERASVSKDHKTLIFGMRIKGGFERILTLSLDEQHLQGLNSRP